MVEVDPAESPRDKVIAENESARQTSGDIRVSVWAIGAAVLIGLAVFGWALSR